MPSDLYCILQMYSYMTLCNCIFSCIIIVVSFVRDNRFTMLALSRLDYFGITLFQELEYNRHLLLSVIGIEVPRSKTVDAQAILNLWLRNDSIKLRPTWMHLFWVLRKMKLSHLADNCEAILSRESVEQAIAYNLDPRQDIDTPERKDEEDKEEGEIHS